MYPPHHLGGYELVWQSWVEHAARDGHEVSVLCSDLRLPGAPVQRESPSVPVERALRWYWRDHGFPHRGLRERLAIERHNRAVLDRVLRELRPAAVVWWAMGGMSLALLEQVRRAGLPAVAMVCDDWLLYAPRVDAWQRIWARRPRLAPLGERVSGAITRVDIAAAARFLFVSEAVRRKAALALPQMRGGEIIRQAPNTDLFTPAPEREWGWRLLCAGRIDRRKGIDLAIRALAELSEAELCVLGAGDEEYLDDLRGLVRRLGVAERVRFEHSAQERLAEAYAAADAVLFPVLWEEPWGLVPLEAMAVGRPTVATGRGGSGEYLEHGRNCLLFDPEAGAGALAARVRELAADRELRGRLREGGFETVAALSADRFNERLLEAATEAAAGSRL